VYGWMTVVVGYHLGCQFGYLGHRTEPADFQPTLTPCRLHVQARRCLDAVDLLGHLLVVQVGYFASAVIIPAGRPQYPSPITH